MLLALTEKKRNWPPHETFIHQLKMRYVILQWDMVYVMDGVQSIDRTECWVDSAKGLQTARLLPQEQACKSPNIHRFAG